MTPLAAAMLGFTLGAAMFGYDTLAALVRERWPRHRTPQLRVLADPPHHVHPRPVLHIYDQAEDDG